MLQTPNLISRRNKQKYSHLQDTQLHLTVSFNFNNRDFFMEFLTRQLWVNLHRLSHFSGRGPFSTHTALHQHQA